METDFSYMDFDLSEVASNGCFPVLNIALDNLELYNFDVNFRDNRGNCLLHYAAERGNIETTKKLLSLSAFPDALNSKGQTPLHIACLHNHNSIVKLLLQNNAKINAIDYYGESPIFLSVRNRNASLIKFLISGGVEIYSRNNMKETLLHIAAEVGDKSLGEFFIDQGLNINSQTICGETPLTLAIKNGHPDVVALLIKSGVDCNKFRNYRNCNLIHLAVKSNQLEICKLLIAQNIDINYLDDYGCSPLHLAAENNSEEIIKLLLDNSAFIDQQDVDDYTPLHVAASKKHNETAVDILFHSKARLDLLTFNGDLPLHRAAASGNEKGVMLLYTRESANCKNKSGCTPLSMAEEKGRISIVYFFKNMETFGRTSNSDALKKRVSFTGIPVFMKERKSTCKKQSFKNANV